MKRVLFSMLMGALPCKADNHDVGIAGKDYPKLIEPDHIRIVVNTADTFKYCGADTYGCAMLGWSAPDEGGNKASICVIYHKSNLPKGDNTLAHELKHCYGWSHDEMPNVIKGNFMLQKRWLEKAHSRWYPMPDDVIAQFQK